MFRRRLVVTMVAAATVSGGIIAMAGSASGARVQQVLFTQPGAYAWTVPNGVKVVSVEARGGAGGDTLGSSGGVSGETEAKFAVRPMQTIQIVVGGRGEDVDFDDSTGGQGGFNGGGSGTDGRDVSSRGGAGGGGATDIRLDTIAGACAATLTCPLSARIVVAGGGGGAGAGSTATYGGFGGGLNGSNGVSAGFGATQESGGGTGSFGLGGTGTCTTCGTGGGGGGWFGGGDGDGDLSDGVGGSGGGGSGYVSPLALSGSTTAGNWEVSIGSSGDGSVLITW